MVCNHIVELKNKTMKNTVSTDKATWQGRWNEIKGRIKKSYADLTDDDLTYNEGHEDELLGRLQKKTGKKREELVKWINGL